MNFTKVKFDFNVRSFGMRDDAFELEKRKEILTSKKRHPFIRMEIMCG